jgi:hypothetical protein
VGFRRKNQPRMKRGGDYNDEDDEDDVGEMGTKEEKK